MCIPEVAVAIDTHAFISRMRPLPRHPCMHACKSEWVEARAGRALCDTSWRLRPGRPGMGTGMAPPLAMVRPRGGRYAGTVLSYVLHRGDARASWLMARPRSARRWPTGCFPSERLNASALPSPPSPSCQHPKSARRYLRALLGILSPRDTTGETLAPQAVALGSRLTVPAAS